MSSDVGMSNYKSPASTCSQLPIDDFDELEAMAIQGMQVDDDVETKSQSSNAEDSPDQIELLASVKSESNLFKNKKMLKRVHTDDLDNFEKEAMVLKPTQIDVKKDEAPDLEHSEKLARHHSSRNIGVAKETKTGPAVAIAVAAGVLADSVRSPALIEKLADFGNFKQSPSWFLDPELYDSVKDGSTFIVNNSNKELSFGGGGTNGAIRYYFFEQHRYCCWCFPMGRQPWHLWNTEAGGLYHCSLPSPSGAVSAADDLAVFMDRREKPKAQDGSVYFTPLSLDQRKSTTVEGIFQVVGPMRKGNASLEHRQKCAELIANITQKCLHHAHKRGAKYLILSGISAGIFAEGDEDFSAACRGAILATLLNYFVNTLPGKQLKILLVGRKWDDTCIV